MSFFPDFLRGENTPLAEPISLAGCGALSESHRPELNPWLCPLPCSVALASVQPRDSIFPSVEWSQGEVF